MKSRTCKMAVLLGALMLSAGIHNMAFCGELRPLVLPSEKQNLNTRQQTDSIQASKPKMDASVYKEFEQKVKNLSQDERKKASEGFIGKRDEAIKRKSWDEVEYYSKLIDILKKY